MSTDFEVFEGRQLTAARALAGLSLAELAQAASVTKRTVHRARGRRCGARVGDAAPRLRVAAGVAADRRRAGTAWRRVERETGRVGAERAGSSPGRTGQDGRPVREEGG